MVREAPTPSPNVILLHYRHPQTVHQILNNKRLAEFMNNKNNYIYSVIHIVELAETVLSS